MIVVLLVGFHPQSEIYIKILQLKKKKRGKRRKKMNTSS